MDTGEESPLSKKFMAGLVGLLGVALLMQGAVMATDASTDMTGTILIIVGLLLSFGAWRLKTSRRGFPLVSLWMTASLGLSFGLSIQQVMRWEMISIPIAVIRTIFANEQGIEPRSAEQFGNFSMN